MGAVVLRRRAHLLWLRPLQVLASCRTREACGGRFGCSSGDVLSCIMHVVSRGCVRRREDNPHVLEFLPEDPATPQKGHAHFSFSEDGKDAAEDHIRCDL